MKVTVTMNKKGLKKITDAQIIACKQTAMKMLAEKYTNLYDGKTASNYIKERLMQK